MPTDPPIPGEMFPYQKASLSRLGPGRQGLFLPYGTGKSWIILSFLSAFNAPQLSALKPGLRIIFCKRRNILTWRLEIQKRQGQDIPIYESTKGLLTLLGLSRGHSSMRQETYLLFPHHRIAKAQEDLIRLVQRQPVLALVGDETTRWKNPKTHMTQGALAVSAAAPEHILRFVMAGRPMPEGPHEIWSQFEFIYPGKNPLGPTYYRFLRKWFIKTDYAWALDIAKTKDFYSRIRNHAVHLTPEELKEYRKHLNCTPRYTLELYEPTAEQKRLLKHLHQHWELPRGYSGQAEELDTDSYMPGGVEEYSHSMSVLQKATQIASGFYYLRDKSVLYLDKCPKSLLLIALVKELLLENPSRKVLVWSRYIAERGPLQLALAHAGIPTVIGPEEDALLAFSSTNSHSPRVIIMPSGISEGFNELKIADVAIFYSNIYSSELRDQAEKRLLRLGQKGSTVTFIDLASPDLMDQEIITSLQSKHFTSAVADTIVRKHYPEPATRP